jgi:hypothetical protein
MKTATSRRPDLSPASVEERSNIPSTTAPSVSSNHIKETIELIWGHILRGVRLATLVAEAERSIAPTSSVQQGPSPRLRLKMYHGSNNLSICARRGLLTKPCGRRYRRYRSGRCSELPFSRARVHSKHDGKHRSSRICEYGRTSGVPGRFNHCSLGLSQ